MLDPGGFGFAVTVGANREAEAREELASIATTEEEVHIDWNMSVTLHFHDALKNAKLVDAYDQEENEHIL